MIKLPEQVKSALEILHRNNYEAYVVGGAVRDALLGRLADDWDITTDAKTHVVQHLFPKHFDTGIKNGTVTILQDNMPIEVTTFRIDGLYEGRRKPSEVTFVNSLAEDLKRRDFTVNAIAYNENCGIIDLHNGMEDLKNGIIRAIGNPDERFQEDALRMLRAVRFAALLSFRIEENTLSAIKRNKHLLSFISAERINAELSRLIMADSHINLLIISEIAEIILPELASVNDEIYQLPYVAHIRWAKLLENIEPTEILDRLKFDNITKKKVKTLIKWSNKDIASTPEGHRRAASELGCELYEDLLTLKGADKKMFEEINEKKEALTIAELAVNGEDMIALGAEGAEIGIILKNLLDVVLSIPELNNREKLINLANFLIKARKKAKCSDCQ